MCNMQKDQRSVPQMTLQKGHTKGFIFRISQQPFQKAMALILLISLNKAAQNLPFLFMMSFVVIRTSEVFFYIHSICKTCPQSLGFNETKVVLTNP